MSLLFDLVKNNGLAKLAEETRKYNLSLHIQCGSLFMVVVDDGIGSEVPIKEEDIEQYLKDKDLFFAKHYGVEKQLYVKWKEAIRAGDKCWAETKQRRPCRSQSFRKDSIIPADPRKFDPNKPVYCTIHEDRTSSVKDSR